MRLAFKIFDNEGEGRLSREDAARVLRRVWPDLADESFDTVGVY